MNRPDEGVGQGTGGGMTPTGAPNLGAGPPTSPTPSRIIHTPSGLGAPRGGSSGGSAGAASPPPSAPEAATSYPTPPEELATAVAQAAARGSAAATPTAASPTPKQIRTFGDRKRHEDSWARTPNTTGTGAIHVKTFHGKLTDEAMVYLDQQVNEWLDAHPQYEVKFVSTAIGDFTGKLKEPHLIVQVWV